MVLKLNINVEIKSCNLVNSSPKPYLLYFIKKAPLKIKLVQYNTQTIDVAIKMSGYKLN